MAAADSSPAVRLATAACQNLMADASISVLAEGLAMSAVSGWLIPQSKRVF